LEARLFRIKSRSGMIFENSQAYCVSVHVLMEEDASVVRHWVLHGARVSHVAVHVLPRCCRGRQWEEKAVMNVATFMHRESHRV